MLLPCFYSTALTQPMSTRYNIDMSEKRCICGHVEAAHDDEDGCVPLGGEICGSDCTEFEAAK
jgi:hypothetical protein